MCGCLSCATDSGTESAVALRRCLPAPAAPDPVFVSDEAAEDDNLVAELGAFLPEVFWAPRPAEVDLADEDAVPPRAGWESDTDGRGPLSRKGLPAA